LSNEQSPHNWFGWLIAGTWVAIILAGVITSSIHPSTAVNASLNSRRISFQTSANRILGASNEKQLLVSGVRSLQIHLNSAQLVQTSRTAWQASQLDIVGERYASCSFYRVRSDGFDLKESPTLIMEWEADAGPKAKSFSLSAHGFLTGILTSQAAIPGHVPGFTCTQVHINGGPAGDVRVRLSPQGGDSILLATASDARFDFDLSPDSTIGDTQIPILGDLRFWDVEPGSGDTKTVLLGTANKIVFERVNQSFILNEADLLFLVPQKDFYLRRFAISDGIHLSLHGIVREAKSGAGASALESLMPSLFDHIDSKKRFWSLIAVVAMTIVGLIDRAGFFKSK
jgi:hypothetical protein